MTDREQMTDQEFFDAPSPVGDRKTRREAIEDYASDLEDEAQALAHAVRRNDLTTARERFGELRAYLDAIDDNLCERDANGARVEKAKR